MLRIDIDAPQTTHKLALLSVMVEMRAHVADNLSV